MKLPCGCCAGIEVVTPQIEADSPDLSFISYRVGTYATFFETMLARLSSLCIDVPSVDGTAPSTILRPLRQLTTRDTADPAIALLDAWAVVADVLTFYEERMANEGYLPTATERGSVLELAHLIGYKLRPGVSASVYLAFTIAQNFQGILPAGTRAQSIPAAGQTAQYFETSVDLNARDTWNAIKPRLTRPQVITRNVDPGTDASTRETIYFAGTSTELTTNDAVLFVLNDDQNSPADLRQLRLIDSVTADTDNKRTEVVLHDNSVSLLSLNDAFQPFVDEADSIFANNETAAQVKAELTPLLANAANPVPPPEVPVTLARIKADIEGKHDIAVKRNFNRLEPWLAKLLTAINLQIAANSGIGDQGTPIPPPANLSSASSLRRLVGIVDSLAAPPSLQPANSQALPRSVYTAFGSQSDIAPRLLAKFHPLAAATIYKAWSGSETPSATIKVMAMRVKATLFPGAYAGRTTLIPDPAADGRQFLSTNVPPSIYNSWRSLGMLGDVEGNKGLSTIALDSAYDKIIPGSWIAICRPLTQQDAIYPDTVTSYHKVTAVRTSNLSTAAADILPPTSPGVPAEAVLGDPGFTAKVTQLTIDPPWLKDIAPAEAPAPNPGAVAHPELYYILQTPSFLHRTVVYAQSESLDLAEEPLDTDVEGSTIELDGVYTGLTSGQWIMVTGERTNIDGTSGVVGNELVMIGAVSQGTGAPLSAVQGNTSVIPFQAGVYVTGPNANGDRLVVGTLAPNFIPAIGRINPAYPNQVYAQQLQLAPGLFVNAYVPSQTEQKGLFPDFDGLLVDPTTGVAFPKGTISADSFKAGLFAWRISTQPVHTILTLAKSLAYTYDATTVTINANVVNATNGQSTGEVLGDGDATQAFDAFPLHQKPVTYLSAATPDGAASTLVVRVNEIQWHEQPNFAALGPKDRSFVTQRDNSELTTVVFGNGQNGARVSTGTANIKATYRYGMGSAGNVDAAQISQLATHPLGAQGVINPFPATGGADPDSLDQARRNAPVAVMALDRLVSTDDYQELARTYAGIGKASAMRITDGRREVVHVTVAGAGDIPIATSSDLYSNLLQSLLRFGDPYLPVQIAVRMLKLLVVSASVQILPDYDWDSVEPQIRAALLDKFSFDNRALGQSAFLSEAIAAMQGTPGVSYVNVHTFDAVAENVGAAELAGLASTLTKYNHVFSNLARTNPNFDPATNNDPTQRILPAELVYLTPDIADMLILTQMGAS